MTKYAALHNFFEGFQIPVYEQDSLPDLKDRTFPYITYSVGTDSFNGEVALTFSIWYRSTSWVGVNTKAEEISTAISRGGKIIPCDGGAMWIKRATPFAQHLADDTDDMIRRMVCNISVEYFTED
jgi:hypothetical protein